jgi:phage terminase large subunit GpA-like protein
MDAFTDPKVRRIVMVSASQVGKSELENNILGYIIDQDPGSVLFIHPTTIDAKDYSKLRIAPMIRDSSSLRYKVSDPKSRDSGNTILQKNYPGGILTLCGSTEAHALASKPIRYIIGDERDRWATSAGNEGDPWELARARQITFYNSKAVEVSTPTIKNASAIEASFAEGTMERWCTRCPHCGEYHNIRWDDLRYEHTAKDIAGKTSYSVSNIRYVCSGCGAVSGEDEIKAEPSKWIAENPEAYEKGCRSFWLNAFCSPWATWESIILLYLSATGSSRKMQVVYNTRFGELWEDRGGLIDDDELMARSEEYPADLPDGVLMLTCGVDTQDDRLEFEIVGFGHWGENWGIRRGVIMGRPDSPEVWQRLDDVINQPYKFKSGVGLRVSMTFVDEGGHFTQEVRLRCRERQARKVFAIKGMGGISVPFTSPPKQQKIVIGGKTLGMCWQYQLGVDAGKQVITDDLRVQTPGKHYCHFPHSDDYGAAYFKGLLSERLVYKSEKKQPWTWEKIPGHERNEALDCFDSETEVLTYFGWKRFADVAESDELATVNLLGTVIEYQKPSALIVRPHNGEMVEIKGRRIDILVTPNHRMVTYKKVFDRAAHKWNFDVPPLITLAKDLTRHHQLMAAADWIGEDKPLTIPASVSAQGAAIEPERTVAILPFARFLGWYISDGHRYAQRAKSQSGIKRRVIITQKESAKAESIRKILDELPWKWFEVKNNAAGDIRSFVITSKQLYDFLDDCGEKQSTRRIPQYIKDASAETISAFLDCAVLGDGWTQTKENRRPFRTYATTSKRLADDIQELFIKTGCASNIRTLDDLPPCSLTPGCKPSKTQYHVTECKRRKASLDGGSGGKREYIGKTVQYSGMVYCATVSNGTLICRRNGKSFIAGNCRNYALAAFKALPKDLDAIDRRLKSAEGKGGAESEVPETAPAVKKSAMKRRQSNALDKYYSEW